jgi:hypothetical protein
MMELFDSPLANALAKKSHDANYVFDPQRTCAAGDVGFGPIADIT